MAVNDGEYTFGEFSTDAAYLGGDDYIAAGMDPVDSNTQLMWWLNAQEAFEQYIVPSTDPPIDRISYVIICLATSLSHLFGHNHTGNPNGNTPSLNAFINEHLPKDGFDLQNESDSFYNSAYDVMVALIEDYNDVAKHVDISKREKALQESHTNKCCGSYT
jgi:hypothetical protein